MSNYVYKGKIVDNNGNPLPAAKVTVTAPDGKTYQTFSSASGEWRVEAPAVGDTKNTKVTISKDGYDLKNLQNIEQTAGNAFFEYRASTDPTKMYNFPKVGASASNSLFGLKGNSSKEYYRFKSTVDDILKQSIGPSSSYFSNFTPDSPSPNGTYEDYLQIGSTSLSDDPSKSDQVISQKFTLENKSDVIIATHNGLLALKRLMDRLNGNQGKVTVLFDNTVRQSDKKYYDPNQAARINPTLKLFTTFAAYLMINQDGFNPNIIKDQFAIKIGLRGESKNSIELKLKNTINLSLYKPFLAFDDQDKDINVVKQEYGFKGWEATNLSLVLPQIKYRGTEGNYPTVKSQWNSFIESYKQIYIENYSMYVKKTIPDQAQNAIDNFINILATQNDNDIIIAFEKLFKETQIIAGTQSSPSSNILNQLYNIGA